MSWIKEQEDIFMERMKSEAIKLENDLHNSIMKHTSEVLNRQNMEQKHTFGEWLNIGATKVEFKSKRESNEFIDSDIWPNIPETSTKTIPPIATEDQRQAARERLSQFKAVINRPDQTTI